MFIKDVYHRLMTGPRMQAHSVMLASKKPISSSFYSVFNRMQHFINFLSKSHHQFLYDHISILTEK